jgi:hypothetical protein
MGKYYLHKDGHLYGTGQCQDGLEQRHARDGMAVGLGDPPPGMIPPPHDEPYQFKRRSQYPPMGDQMDALWHAMKDGILPKVEPFFSEIEAVKTRYPKSN